MTVDQTTCTTGLALCQQDSYTTSVITSIVSCEPLLKKGKSSDQGWAVRLSSTPLYPESGGQPADAGWLQLEDGSEEKVEIYDVQRDADGSTVHYLSAPVTPGTQAEAQLAWQRRFDHMQQHTGQHLVSAVADEIAGADTSSWELHAISGDEAHVQDNVVIDLTIASLNPGQIEEIERRCNAIIRQSHTVRPIIIASRDDEVLKSPILRGELPPPDKVKGPIRLIEIEGVDINACGGTHLRSTAEIQGIKITGLEKKSGQVRLSFVAGGRLLSSLGRSLKHQADLNKVLGCGPTDHTKIISKLQSDRRGLQRQTKALLEEVAAHDAARLAATASTGTSNYYHRDDADLPFLQWVASAALKANPEALLLLTGGDVATAKRGVPVEGPFLLAGPPDRVKEVGPKIAEMLRGKGGGRPGQFQGKAGDVGRAPEAAEALL